MTHSEISEKLQTPSLIKILIKIYGEWYYFDAEQFQRIEEYWPDDHSPTAWEWLTWFNHTTNNEQKGQIVECLEDSPHKAIYIVCNVVAHTELW